jgi:hypothetical protein
MKNSIQRTSTFRFVSTTLGLCPLLAAAAFAQSTTTAPTAAHRGDDLTRPGQTADQDPSTPASNRRSAATSGGQTLVLNGGGSVEYVGAPIQNINCPDAIQDQAGGDCIQASADPALGMLYPMTENLCVEPSGFVGVGAVNPATQLHVFANAANAGVTRFDNEHPDGFSGVYFDENGQNEGWAGYVNSGSVFGAPGTMQIGASHSDLVFSTNGSGFFDEKMRIQVDGDVGIGTNSPEALLHVDGRVRMGSEAGTSQSPDSGFQFDYGGIVTRRVYSSSNAAGQVVARGETIRLERDGTSGGLIIIWGATNNSVLNCNGYAVTSSGTVLPIRQTAINQTAGGTRQITLDADSVVSLHATFGNFHNGQHTTTVTLNRSLPSSNTWLGSVTSTFDQ